MAQHSTSSLLRFSVLILLIVGVVYSNALFNGFVYDDWDLVVRNPWVREGSLIEAFRIGYWESSRGGSFYYRPVVSASYWVDYALWGEKPFGYHLRNVALHALSSILVLFLAARWMGSRPAAAAAAAIFAVHPIHTQSVTWIAGRTDLLATLFCLAALFLIQAGVDRLDRSRVRPIGPDRTPQRAPSPGKRIASTLLILAGFIAAALALLSKEMAATFPALLLLHILILRRETEAPRWKSWALPLAGSIFLVAGWLLLRSTIVGATIGFADDPHAWWHPADGTSARILAVPLILSFYLRRLLFPLSLGFESGLQPLHDFADPALWSAAAGIALLAGLAWRFRRREPTVTFGIFWLLISLLPVLNILPVFESAMEHFAYLPSVGFAVAAVAVGRTIVKKPEARVAVCVGLIVLLGVRTMIRNGDWRDEETFWRITVRDTPSARAWNNLGLYLREKGDLEGAAAALDEVRRLRPDLPSSHANLGVVEAARGQRLEAIKHFHEALSVDPAHRDSLYNLAITLETNPLGERYGQGFPADETVAVYRNLVAAHPDHAEGWTNLGVLFERLGRPAEAREAFEAAIRSAPGLAEPHLFLADLLWTGGHRESAAALYRRYLELAPGGEGAPLARSRSSP